MDAAAAQARDDGDEQLYSSEEDGGLHDDEARRTPPPAGHLQLEAAVAQLLAAVASAGTNDYPLGHTGSPQTASPTAKFWALSHELEIRRKVGIPGYGPVRLMLQRVL